VNPAIEELLEDLACHCESCASAERDRLSSLWEAATAAERERCARVLTDYADTSAYDPEEHDDIMTVVELIRSGKPSNPRTFSHFHVS